MKEGMKKKMIYNSKSNTTFSPKVAMTTTIAQRVQGRQAKGETVVHEQVCGN